MKDQALVQMALYAALVAALGLIPPVPFVTGIPITAQTLGVMRWRHWWPAMWPACCSVSRF